MSSEALNNWVNLPSHIIIQGTDRQGESLLKQFLLDYVELTGEVINPSCNFCVNEYIKKFKNLKSMKSNEKEVDYKLRSEYNGIPLAFGSNVSVTNDNMTNEYGEILLKRFKKLGTEPEIIFSKFPEQEKEKPKPSTKTKVKTEEVKKDTEPLKTLNEVLEEKSKAETETKEDATEELDGDDFLDALEKEVTEPTVLDNKTDVLDLES